MERSKLTDPVEVCRPSIGTGAPAAAGKLVHRIDPAEHIGAPLVRQMARETALVLIREQARTLCRVMGMGYDEAALVLRLLCVEFTNLHHNSTAPQG